MLKAAIALNGTTAAALAEAAGISPQTFYRRMSAGYFRTGEVERICKVLDIKDPIPIFLPGLEPVE